MTHRCDDGFDNAFGLTPREINPIATLALFAGLTASFTRAERHWTALRACIYATIIVVAAMTVGQVENAQRS